MSWAIMVTHDHDHRSNITSTRARAERAAEGPPSVRKTVRKRAVSPVSRFNTKVALGITRSSAPCGAPTCSRRSALVSLPAAIISGSPIIIVGWIAQTFLQLVLLPVIIVGQNIQAAASDDRAAATYKDAGAILEEAKQIQLHLAAQDAATSALLDRILAIEQKVVAGKSPPPPPRSYSRGSIFRAPGSGWVGGRARVASSHVRARATAVTRRAARLGTPRAPLHARAAPAVRRGDVDAPPRAVVRLARRPDSARVAHAALGQPVDPGHRVVPGAGAGRDRVRALVRAERAAGAALGRHRAARPARADRGPPISGAGRRAHGDGGIPRPALQRRTWGRRTSRSPSRIVSAIVRGARVWAWVSIAVALDRARSRSPWCSASTDWHAGPHRGHDPRHPDRRSASARASAPGASVRTSSAAVAQRRQTEVQAERVRIARELHDVLAHSLTQINVQAGVGLHLMDTQPEKAHGGAREHQGDEQDGARRGARRCSASCAPRTARPERAARARARPRPARRAWSTSVTAQGLDVTLRRRTSSRDAPAAGPARALPHRAGVAHERRAARAGATAVDVALERDGGEYAVDRARRRPTGAAAATEPAAAACSGMRERAELLGGRSRPDRPTAAASVVAARASRRTARRRPDDPRASLADDQQLIRAGFRACSRPSRTSRSSARPPPAARRSRSCARRIPTSCSWTSGCPTATASGRPSRSSRDPALGGHPHRRSSPRSSSTSTSRRRSAPGASGFLVKDTEPVELIRAVRVVAGGDALLQPGRRRGGCSSASPAACSQPPDAARSTRSPTASARCSRSSGRASPTTRSASGSSSARSPRRPTSRAS